MALPSITQRPEKDLIQVGEVYSYFTSKWNAVHNPIIYKITNDKWPTNSLDAEDNITGQADNNGLVEFTIAGHSYDALSWVTIADSDIENYNGVWQITETTANTITLDLPYEAGAIGTPTAQLYYNNYFTSVRLYAGIPSGHLLNLENPIAYRFLIKVKPDANNETLIDLAPLLRDYVNLLNDLNLVPNDTNRWSAFYIEFAENYDIISSGDIVAFTSNYTSDSLNIFYCSNSKMAFQHRFGYNMGEWVMQDSGVAGEFMTKFEKPKLWLSKYFDISCIIDETIINKVLTLVINEYSEAGALLALQTDAITLQDEGVYRLQLNAYPFNDLTDFIKIWIRYEGASDQMFTDPTFLNGLADWTQSDESGDGAVWGLLLGQVWCLGFGVDNSYYLYQTIAISNGAGYTIRVQVTALLNNSTMHVVGYTGAVWKTIDSFNVPSDGLYEFDFISDDNYTDIGIWFESVSGPSFSVILLMLSLYEQAGAPIIVSEEKTINIERECSDQSIYLTWLNNLGGWEYFNFTARKEYGIEISDDETFTKQIFEEDDYINGETVESYLTMKARRSVKVISQFLTQDEVQAIATIKHSIMVQEITDAGKITVLIDKGSFKVREDRQKLFTIEFDLIYTDDIPIQNP